MGSMKDEWMDRQDAKADKELAEILGITDAELQQTQFERSDETSEDGLIYSYLIVFDPSASSKEVLAKIDGLDENYTVRLDPGVFSDQEPGGE